MKSRFSMTWSLWAVALLMVLGVSPAALAAPESTATSTTTSAAPEEPSGETTPAAPEGPTAETSDATSGEGEGEGEGEDNDAVAALGAANPVVAANTGKAWQLMGSVGANMGSSTFASNQRTQAGYNVSLTGLYRISPLFQGRLDLLARTSFDQSISDGFVTGLGQTSPNQFFWRDTRVGLLGRGLYRWKDLGIVFGANTSVDLPTSEQSQRTRLFRWNLGLNAVRMTPKVGPGSLLAVVFAGFRKDASYVNPTIAPFSSEGSRIANCTVANADEQGNCFTAQAGVDWGVSYGASLRYFLGNFSIGAGVSFLDIFLYDLSNSELPPELRAGVSSDGVDPSQFAIDAPNHVFFMSTSVSATYVINANFNVNAGISSFQVPFRYQNGNPRALISPFFDSPERGATSLSLSLTAMY